MLFLEAWESPIIITRETFYRKSNNNLVSNNPKLPKSNSQDLINQDNSDLSTTDVIITNLISKDYLPCIMLTGFGLALKEQRVCCIVFLINDLYNLFFFFRWFYNWVAQLLQIIQTPLI